MRCVSYTRFVSSMPEKEVPTDIIKQQNDRIGKYAKQHSWTIEKKYSDRKNDKTADAAFKEMKSDGMARKFDMLVIDSFYRLGPNVSVARTLLSEVFYPSGIHFAVAEDTFCSEGKTPAEMEQYFARKYADHRTMLRWNSVMEKREEGFFNVHDERYGYLLSEDHRQLVVDEEAAAVIREVFQLTADGYTMKQIAEEMNKKGYETPAQHLERVSQKHRFTGRSTAWTASIVKTVSSCTQYLGKVRKKIRGEYVQYNIPQIIDAELYERSIAAKRKHYHGSPKNRSEFNPFKFIIRDRRTDTSLICLTNQRDRSKRIFCIGRKTEDQSIPYETVYDSVVEILKKEIGQAEHVSAMLKTEEASIIYSERRQAIIRSLRRLMKEVSDISIERISLNAETDETIKEKVIRETDDRLEQCEQKYLNRLEEFKMLETAFTNNPWVNLYKGIVIDDSFDDAQIRRLIETVWVRDFKYVTADMRMQEWKSMLPRKWRKGESVYGAEEQENI